jgi:hypothetical protein
MWRPIMLLTAAHRLRSRFGKTVMPQDAASKACRLGYLCSFAPISTLMLLAGAAMAMGVAKLLARRTGGAAQKRTPGSVTRRSCPEGHTQ